MDNTRQLLKCIIDEMSTREWDNIRDELISALPPAGQTGNRKPGDTGLSDREAMLIRKLAKKTEELYRIFKRDSDQDQSSSDQE